MARSGSETIQSWPEESREATQLVIDKYGEPHEATDTQLTWHRVGPWKRIVASKAFYQHDFPAPHQDCVETVIDYRVPADKFTDLALFDGSVIVERTAGEVSARCHDEEVTGRKTVQEARDYYAKEFLDYRRGKPTPYMQSLQFTPPSGGTADPDQRALSDADLQRAVEEGKKQG
jgi:hypothetical protein